MGNKIKLAILWHMHQPDYRSPVASDFTLPWVRLHGIKDYYGMVHLLGQFPGIKMTFNLVPSLLVQLQQYLAGGEDLYQKIFAKPADSLFPDEIGFLVTHFFKANRDHLIRRHPGYETLYRKKRRNPCSTVSRIAELSCKKFSLLSRMPMECFPRDSTLVL